MSMNEVQVKGKRFSIKSKLKAMGVRFPNEEPNPRFKTFHNQFEVEVCELDLEKCTKFDYFGSNQEWEDDKKKMTQEDEKFAFRTLFDEGISGDLDFVEFCGEFGYECDDPEGRKRAKKVHKAIKGMRKKVDSLGVSEDEMYDILNALSEQGIE